MRSVSALNVRKHFGQLLDEAAAGERLVIERAGVPVAALVPLSDLAASDPDRRRAGRLKAIDDIVRLARQRSVDRSIDAATLIREQRQARTEQITRAVPGEQKAR